MLMKRIGGFISVAALTLTSGHAFAADAKAAAPAKVDDTKVEDYILDAAHCKIGFEVPHLVVSSVEGRFKTFEGSFSMSDKLTKDNAKNYKASVMVDTASIDTGIDKRDNHLKSADFFDATKFPKLKFVSTSADVDGEKKLKLRGDLTIKDKTKPIVFDVAYKGTVNANDKKRSAFKATAEISRKDFGLMWNDVVEAGPVVGDAVTITLNIEGIRKSDMGAH